MWVSLLGAFGVGTFGISFLSGVGAESLVVGVAFGGDSGVVGLDLAVALTAALAVYDSLAVACQWSIWAAR